MLALFPKKNMIGWNKLSENIRYDNYLQLL